jgi:hypothetical protein
VSAVDATAPTAPLRPRTAAEQRICRLLCLTDATPVASEESTRRLVEKSLFISMARCLLTYIVLPFVAPALGVASGVGPVVGLLIGTVAIVANVASVRRFWRADHRYRWHYTALSAVIVSALLWLMVTDLIDLLA